eukprot:scaffold2315_cov113-Cylindrotheca_fusiformis.AAC.2
MARNLCWGGNDWPWTPARMQSNGKLRNQDMAPANPPAMGTATCTFNNGLDISSSRIPSYTKK